MLNNNLALAVGGNNLPSFFSSILWPDFINRFLCISTLSTALVANNSGIWRSIVFLSISLPFQNLLTKFKNKVHLLIYILIFETITSQRPIVQTVMSKSASAKNKRERRKAQDGVRVEGYTLSASLHNPEHLQNFLNTLLYFVVPNTNKKKTAPSRFVSVSLGMTHSVIKFSLRGLANLPFGFVADDLSALRTVLEIQIHPFSNFTRSKATKILIDELSALRFVVFGLGVTDISNSGSLNSIVNLRLKSLSV